MSSQPLRYAETHEWVRVEHEGDAQVATIGITDFAVQQLTDLVYMDLPEVGRQLSAGDEFGEVESVKAVSPMYSPVSGEVVAVNSDLPDHLEVLGTDAFGEGWIIKLRMSDPSELEKLLDEEAYQRQCAAEG